MIEYSLNGRKIQIVQDEEDNLVRVSINGDNVDSLDGLTELMLEITKNLSSIYWNELTDIEVISDEIEKASVAMSQLAKKCSLLCEKMEREIA